MDYLTHICCILIRRQALEGAGALDERFRDLDAAWMDYCLRLQLAGTPVFLAQDALAFCKAGGPRDRSAWRLSSSADKELLIGKWSGLSLRFMESLALAAEPKGYRVDAALPEAGSLR